MKTDQTYIAILRGINVLGKKIIKMEALRIMMERLGFGEVRTYIQSGNVVFRTKNQSLTDITDLITDRIHTDFGLRVPLIVLDNDMLERVIKQNPFVSDLDLDAGKMHVTFLSSPPSPFDREAIEAKKQDGEHIALSEHAVYLYCPNGYGNTKLSNDFLEKKLGVMATTRNWRTVLELMEICRRR
jgi:uncharacterized protein (DUF1697 family)